MCTVTGSTLRLASVFALAGIVFAGGCGSSNSWSIDSTNHTNQTITSGGITRSFYVHLPSDYSSTKPAPVVLSYHGFDETEPQQELISGLSQEGLLINNTVRETRYILEARSKQAFSRRDLLQCIPLAHMVPVNTATVLTVLGLGLLTLLSVTVPFH